MITQAGLLKWKRKCQQTQRGALGGALHRRRQRRNRQAHHQKRLGQEAGGVQSEAGRRNGSHQGRRCQSCRRVHRSHVAAKLV